MWHSSNNNLSQQRNCSAPVGFWQHPLSIPLHILPGLPRLQIDVVGAAPLICTAPEVPAAYSTCPESTRLEYKVLLCVTAVDRPPNRQPVDNMQPLGATFVPGGYDDYYMPEVVAPAPQRRVLPSPSKRRVSQLGDMGLTLRCSAG